MKKPGRFKHPIGLLREGRPKPLCACPSPLAMVATSEEGETFAGEAARKASVPERDPEFGLGGWRRPSILDRRRRAGHAQFPVRTLGPRCKRIEEAADVDGGLAQARRSSFRRGHPRQHHAAARTASTGWPSSAPSASSPTSILITAYADLETAIQALRAGAVDFVLKPFRSNQILNAVARCLDRMRLQRENFVLRYELKSTSDHILLRDRLIGTSRVIARCPRYDRAGRATAYLGAVRPANPEPARKSRRARCTPCLTGWTSPSCR